MSEYQYYEFQAVDRPLTEKEMRELRSYSTRAHITPTSFIVDYSWGGFKGDEDIWMEKYFDAFLYLSNWGTRILKLRLPSRLLDSKTALKYCGGENVSIVAKTGKVILSFVSEDEEGGEWIEGSDHLSSLISVRNELARGDLRALYLGWLLRVQTDELDNEDIEPPVPPGFDRLSASLRSLVEFLRIDSDLLHVADRASASLKDEKLKPDEVREWVAGLPAEERDDIVTRFIYNADDAFYTETLKRFHKERSGQLNRVLATGRTVGEILRAVEVYTAERKRIEAKTRTKDKARREKNAAIAREKHLDEITGCEEKLWTEVEKLIAAKQSKTYDQAVRLLMNLRDLGIRDKNGDFYSRFELLKQRCSRKSSFIERLKRAGL
ncbi:MAG: hypothetical protein EHM45_09415 [Desulfobacteraceae bacterium]|nr:MAG: hypothetical protein EHM45_09415 [Desulfobacteraceae bacterium]